MKLSYDQVQALTSYFDLNANSNDSKSAHNGTDTAIIYSAGKFGNGATFNGTTSKIVLPDHADFKPTGAFTLGMWFKANPSGVSKGLFQSWNYLSNVGYGIQLYISSDNILVFKNSSVTLSGKTIVADNTFHYVVITFNNNYCQVYLDGKLELSGYMEITTYNATNYIRIGCTNEANIDANFINGMIDDLFLINGYALDEKTIRDKYISQTAQGVADLTLTKMAFVSADPIVNAITLYHGTDYMLSNSAISNIKYSNVKKPFGFNINPDKWQVQLLSVDAVSTGSVASKNTCTNFTNLLLTVPIGNFGISFRGRFVSVHVGTGYLGQSVGLSTLNNAFTDKLLYVYGNAINISNAENGFVLFLQPVNIKNYLKTIYYLNTQAFQDATTQVAQGTTTPTLIKAISNYL